MIGGSGEKTPLDSRGLNLQLIPKLKKTGGVLKGKEKFKNTKKILAYWGIGLENPFGFPATFFQF